MQNLWLDDPAQDRIALKRRDEGWLEAQRKLTSNRMALIWRDKVMVEANASGLCMATVSVVDPTWSQRITGPLVLLAEHEGAQLFAAEVDPTLELEEAAQFENLRTAGPGLSEADAALLGYAKALVYWHNGHRFCGVCGSETVPQEGGHSRRCIRDGCRTEHYPRTDSAVIVLVHRGARCLLGRSARFPPKMVSTLAGFVEPGESLEACVRREVFEEAGVRVGAMRYLASQPWPFPRSLMIGFVAEATSEEIVLDPQELEFARWFTKQEVEEALAQKGDFRVPGPLAIAHHLILDWLRG